MTADRNVLGQFLDEIKRRRVGRVAVAYAAVGWMLIEVADTVLPRMGAPELAVTALVWAVVLFAPAALILAWLFDVGPEGIRRTPAGADPDRKRALGGKAAAVVVVLIAFGVAGYLAWGPRTAAELELRDDRVVVLPFRVAGASADLAYLGEGMVDLLAATLTGELGPAAVDPAAVMARLEGAGPRRTGEEEVSAFQVARSLGAARFIRGAVVGRPGSLIVTAVLRDASDASEVLRAEASGSIDSLPALVDDLTAQLLSLDAGEHRDRLVSLTSTSLPALRDYLRGQAASRRGAWEEALRAYDRALERDSTFAHAGLGLAWSAAWLGGTNEYQERGYRIAWRHRDRLGERDQVLLTAAVGPHYPDPSTWRELLRAREAAISALPDNAKLWYDAGDIYYHFRAVLDIPEGEEKAWEYLQRALEFDESFASALVHAITMATTTGRFEALDRLIGQYLEEGSSDATDFFRWRSALAQDDSSTLAEIEARLTTLSTATLRWFAVSAQDDRLPMEVPERAVRVRAERPGSAEEHLERRLGLHAMLLNAGRPAEALEATERIAEVSPDPHYPLRLRVLDALYADGDTTAAVAAAERLERAVRSGADDSRDARSRDLDQCALGQWHAWNGDPVAAGESLRALERHRSARYGDLGTCLRLLDAVHAVAAGRPDAEAVLDELERHMLQGVLPVPVDYSEVTQANLVLSRLRERLGDREGALAAARRVSFFTGWKPFRATYLLREARLSAVLGHEEEAIRAYRHYLTLRHDPGPSRRAAVDGVRQELSALLRPG